MKTSKRYIIFKIHSAEKLNYPIVKSAIQSVLQQWLGELGMSRSNVRLIKNLWDQKSQTGWLSCSTKWLNEVKVGLGLVHQIGESRVAVHCVRVAGTIKSGKEKSKNI